MPRKTTKKKTTGKGRYIGLRTNTKRTKKETNTFLINVMNGASKIFSPK
jgi:hypothetical protein